MSAEGEVPLRRAFEDGKLRVAEAIRSGSGRVERVTAQGAANLDVSFADIDQLTAAIRSHTAFIRASTATVMRPTTDPDLTSSSVLSPGTFAMAEAALLTATAGLTAHAVRAEGIAVVSATIVTTYQLVDNALALAAAQFGGAGRVVAAVASATTDITAEGVSTVGAGVVLTGITVLGLKAAATALASGTLLELSDSFVTGLNTTIDTYLHNPALLVGGMPLFASSLGTATGRAFSPDDALTNTVTNLEAIIASTGPHYDDLLELLIRYGQKFGWFHDREASLGPSLLGPLEQSTRAERAAKASWLAITGTSGPTGWALDNGRIVPRDLASLLAGAAQIDAIGKDDMAVVRVIETVDAGGVARFVVQIPSTQFWNPGGDAIPNDVTSDLHAMSRGDQTGLGQAVVEAMRRAGVEDSPVLLAGFSLGGITAAAIACGDSGFNIQQVVTAGAPIGRMPIPASVAVTSFEAEHDVVTRLDGAKNPDRPNWITVSERGPLLPHQSEDSFLDRAGAHDANRYAVMARDSVTVKKSPALSPFLEGTSTVTDFYATREHR